MRDWLAAREVDLLPVGYFQGVFTLPAEIADIAAHNKAIVYDLLFRAASRTMLTIAADPRHLGTRIGITAVLHSWGSARNWSRAICGLLCKATSLGMPASVRRTGSSTHSCGRYRR